MPFSLHPSTNLKKLQDLPDTSHWIDNDAVWIKGGITVYTRNYGIIDKVSSEARRGCVLTKNGGFIVYMKDKKGFVLDLHSHIAMLTTNDKAKLKKKNTLIKRCKIKMRFKFGTVNFTLYEDEIEKWRNGICDVLDGKLIEKVIERPIPSIEVKKEEPKEEVKEEEEEEMGEIDHTDVSSIYDNTSDYEEGSRPDYETYTVHTKQTEQSMKSEVVPHSDLLSDPPTPPNNEPVVEEESTPTLIQPSSHPTFPPHRTANINIIRPHPPRNLPIFIPPIENPPTKPPRPSLSKIPILAPSPLPRRIRNGTQSIDFSPSSLPPLHRAETFKSNVSNDSSDSRMPYYQGRSKNVQRSPKDRGTVTTVASIELTPRSQRRALGRLAISNESMEKESVEKSGSSEMCSHLEDPVRSYIKECYEQTLKNSRESSHRTKMESKISFFERVNSGTQVTQVNRFSTMPRNFSRPSLNGPATLPRSSSHSTPSRISILEVDFGKESAV